jgi:hypothetical protein
MKRLIAVASLAAVVVLTALPDAAGVKVRTQRDKAFDFSTLRTYAWHPDGFGDVKVLTTTGGDPEAIRAQLEPAIRQAAEQGLAARGLTAAPAEQADVYVNYYLLLGAGISSQHLGQFIGNASEWGLPPISGATTSLEMYEQGSLVLDVSGRTQKHVIFRGVAQAEIDRQRTPEARRDRVRGAVRDMLNDFPRRK